MLSWYIYTNNQSRQFPTQAKGFRLKSPPSSTIRYRAKGRAGQARPGPKGYFAMAAETKPLMPKATAVWLVDNTGLTFEQIADFCGLHPLEVKGIADEDVAKGIKGMDPVTSGQLTREQIEEAEKNPKVRLKMAAPKHKMPNVRLKRAPRYTPVSKRQDKPDAVYWIIRNHPEFADADIIKLIGTTKATIQM